MLQESFQTLESLPLLEWSGRTRSVRLIGVALAIATLGGHGGGDWLRRGRGFMVGAQGEIPLCLPLELCTPGMRRILAFIAAHDWVGAAILAVNDTLFRLMPASGVGL